MATINDVARLAGVSATTAKRAIRFPDKLAPKTLLRVQQAIETLGYEPDRLASALRSGHSSSIGLIVGSIIEPFFAQLVRTIGKEVRQRGYTLVVAENEYDSALELSQLKEFYGSRIAGLIIRSAFGEANVTYLQHLQSRGTAIVEIDYFAPHSPFSHIMLDNEAAVTMGVRYLAQLGHRDIALLGSYDPVVLPDERVQAFPAAMAQHDLKVNPEYQQVVAPNQVAGYQLTHDLMRLEKPPSAIFSSTGTMAIGCYKALKELGIKVPDDISLLSFDNYPWTSLVEPGIDVIEQPVAAMAESAVELLFDYIDKPAAPVQHRRFSGVLIKRGSCQPPKS